MVLQESGVEKNQPARVKMRPDVVILANVDSFFGM